MSWWEEAATQLSSGVESIKKATKDIANELAEADINEPQHDIHEAEDEDEDEDEVEELRYDKSPINDMRRFQEMYQELERAYAIQQKEIEELRTVNEINQNALSNAQQDRQHLEEQWIKSKDELHEFKKKTKTKWDEVKVKIKSQQQENKKLKHKYGDKILMNDELTSFKNIICDNLRNNIRPNVVAMEAKYKQALEELSNLYSILYTNGILKENEKGEAVNNWILSNKQMISKLESKWISVCNELDDVSNANHELEAECDQLHHELEHHQSVLEETRIATQELLDHEQQQNDKLMQQMQELSEENKVLVAQKVDLTKQLHLKLKSDLISDNDTFSNIQSLENETNGLKMTINTLKEHHKRKINEKDEDIMELNTVISELKMECEELRSLQTDYIHLSKKYNKEKLEFETKKTAFDNLQIAFDALQNKLAKSHAINKNNNNNNNNNSDNSNTNDNNNNNIYKEKLDEMTIKYENVTKQFQEIRSKLSQSQKYQIRLEHETSTLRSTISKTAIKLQNLSNSEDQIDRRIIIKLLVTFFDRWYNGGDTKEVISLISKILRFNDKECNKCRVGADSGDNKKNYSLWGYAKYATSWITYDDDNNDDDSNKNNDDDKSKDLGSLWVEFLLNELTDEQMENNNCKTTNTIDDIDNIDNNSDMN